MKKLFVLLLGMVCTLGAAEKVVLVKVNACSVPQAKAAYLLGQDGSSLSMKGATNYQNYGYLVSRVTCKPFKITGKALVLEVKAANFADNDNFYVKGLDSSGKIVTSFRVTANLSGEWNVVTCVPGKRGNGISYNAGEIKNPEGEIVSFQFFCGRRGPALPQEVEIRNLHLVDAPAASSVSVTPLDKPGNIRLLNMPVCYSTSGVKPVAKFTENEVTMSGDCGKKQYNYLVAKINIRPFIFEGNSLSLKVKCSEFLPKDAFYVKALNSDGKVVASFICRRDLSGDGLELICTPGSDGGNVEYIAKESKGGEKTPVVTLQIFCGRFGPAKPVNVEIKEVKLIKRPPAPSNANFTNHGVGIASAELRHFIACHDENGKRLVIGSFSDMGPDYILLTEVDSGRTIQYYSGAAGATYGGVLTSKGKFVYGVAGTVYIFDINKRTMTKGGPCVYACMCGTEAPDGKVYLGGASESRVTMVDPDTGKTEDVGKFDPKENYASFLATDKAGFVYCGIGTARGNVVAMDPVTREKIQLIPEEERKLGTGFVQTGEDGYVYISFGAFNAKCLAGKIVEKGVRCANPKKVLGIKYQRRLKYFDDGSEVQSYDFGKKEIVIREKDGSLRKIKYDFKAGGLNMTSMAAGPDGNIYFSSSHPNHLGKLDVKSGKITDLGYNPKVGGGNMCNMVAFNGKLYGCEYGGGRLWEYDPALPPVYGDTVLNNFGVPFAELIYNSEVVSGTWRDLSSPPVLLALADSKDNRFTLNLNVKEDGRYFLNMQFLHSHVYGTVTVTAGDKKFTYDAFALDREPGRMLNIGPFDLKAGKFPVVFQVEKSDDPKSRLLFSLTGIELAANPRPEFPSAAIKRNPRILGIWPDLITRPRAIAVNPATKEVVIAGFSNYGMAGGGFGIWNSVTGKTREIADWLPGESCYDMFFNGEGNLIGGTSVEAPGGGHETAKCASVFMIDWQSGKVVKHLPLPGVRKIYGVREFGRFIFAVTANGELYRIDKEKWQLDAKFPTQGLPIDRNPLVKTPDGKRLFLLQSKAISEIDMTSGNAKWIAAPPMHLSAGSGIAGSRIYFITGKNIGSWQIPPKK